MTKAQPMSLAEFAEYSAEIPKDRHEAYNRMLSFVEDVVMQKAAKLVCSDCMTSGIPTLSNGHYFHGLHGTVYMCRASGIYKELATKT